MKNLILHILTFTLIMFSNLVNSKNNKLSCLSEFNEEYFKLRKTLDGSKNESQPALLSYKKTDEESYYNIDIAASYGGTSCNSESFDINFTPKIEYHRSTGKKEVRKSSIGINSDLSFKIFEIEYQPNPENRPTNKALYKLNKDICLKANLIDMVNLKSCESIPGSCNIAKLKILKKYEICEEIPTKWHEINPYVLSEASVTRDSINDKTTRKYSMLLSGYSLKPGSLGTPWSYKPIDGGQPNTENLHRFKWLPFIGMESFEKLAIEDGEIEIAPAVNPTFRVARLSLEYYPFRRESESKIGTQIIVNQTYRRLNSSSDIIPNSTRHFEVSLNYFFDKEGHVGIGVDYEDGSSPKRNFLDDEITTVALKLYW